MRALLLLAFALTWISCCVGCGARQTPQSSARELAARLESETVALVRLVDADGAQTDDGTPSVYCAGVFVSPWVIVTAGHCVELGTMPDERLMLNQIGLDEDLGLPKWDPIGRRAMFSMVGDLPRGYWTGRVLAYDRENDLGAVVIDDPYPRHPYAHVSEAAILDGDRVEVVGHPGALYVWSYSEGYVSSWRENDPGNENDLPLDVLQIAAPVSGGNSGGGAFDEFGRLIGVASYIDSRAHGMGFFVHRDAVLRFLRDAKAL